MTSAVFGGWLELLCVALATWRISHMVMYEWGPWGIFLKLREWQKFVHDEDGTPVAYPSNHLFACLWCLSVWVGFILIFLPWWASVPFALSAVSIIIQESVLHGTR